METRSMYETIMDLPLFKGVSADHVSSFIEKTRINFKKYSPDEAIVRVGEEVRTLKFILKGSIEYKYLLYGGRIEVTSLSHGHEAIGVTRLFGMHPRYDMTITAHSEVSIMEFDKEKYLSLLRSDSIYLMNFANFLSLYVQRAGDAFRDLHRLGVDRLIAEWLVLFTTRMSESIRIKGVDILEKIYGREDVSVSLETLLNNGWIEVKEHKILIKDREAILEFVSAKTEEF